MSNGDNIWPIISNLDTMKNNNLIKLYLPLHVINHGFNSFWDQALQSDYSPRISTLRLTSDVTITRHKVEELKSKSRDLFTKWPHLRALTVHFNRECQRSRGRRQTFQQSTLRCIRVSLHHHHHPRLRLLNGHL